MIPDVQKNLILATPDRFTSTPKVVFGCFFDHLFDSDPALREMFPADLDQQLDKIIEMFLFVVNGLDVLDELDTELIELGQRHRGYGVTAAHYAISSTLFIRALSEHTEDWTQKDAKAWEAVFTHMANLMLQGAGAPPLEQHASAR